MDEDKLITEKKEENTGKNESKEKAQNVLEDENSCCKKENAESAESLREEFRRDMKKRMISSSIVIVILVLISSLFYVYDDKLEFDDTRFMMNTAYRMKVYGIRGYLGMQAAYKKIKQIEKEVSFYDKSSAVYKLNHTGEYKFNFENKQKRDLLREIALGAKFVYENTDGYFDPSFAAIHEIYGFHSEDKTGRLPSDEELAKTMLNCGYTNALRIDGDKLTLKSGSMVDFGGIAGGYSIITAKAILETAGCKAFLIDDAGDIWFQGEKPDKSPWKIAVKDPRGGSSLAMIVSKTPLAISTSGDYERFVIVNGKKYGHIIDPKTGKPASYYDSVTVVTHDPIQSDVLSTALFAMPPEKAYKFAEEKNIAVLFLTKSGEITLSNKGKLYFSDIKIK